MSCHREQFWEELVSLRRTRVYCCQTTGSSQNQHSITTHESTWCYPANFLLPFFQSFGLLLKMTNCVYFIGGSCPDGWHSNGISCYKYVHEVTPDIWTANWKCRQIHSNSYLVSVNHETEETFIESIGYVVISKAHLYYPILAHRNPLVVKIHPLSMIGHFGIKWAMCVHFMHLCNGTMRVYVNQFKLRLLLLAY